MSGVKHLNREDLKRALAADEIVVVDVREPHEFANGRIPGAVSMPLSRFEPQALLAHGPGKIVFSCVAGVRSMQALNAARAAGVACDAHYAGGFRDWLMGGEDIERD